MKELTIVELRERRNKAEELYKRNPNPYTRRQLMEAHKKLDKAVFTQLKKEQLPEQKTLAL